MLKNRIQINAALFDNRVLTPGSRQWYQRAMKLGAALTRQERQTLSFHRKTAVKICRKYHEIKVQYPDLVALRHNYGLRVIDCNFLQFLEILENTAKHFGVKLSINHEANTSKAFSAKTLNDATNVQATSPQSDLEENYEAG